MYRVFLFLFQALVNIIDHGMSPQQAVEAPRLWTQGQTVELEASFGANVRDGLAAKGHDITIVPNVAGGMNAVMIDARSGTLAGAACWRADGTPAALAGGHAHTEARFNPLV